MLFLLRKIRRKLLIDNKVKTYMLYAVGEVFLVVVGILIAVSIDNWNDLRNSKLQSYVYLQRLGEDVQAILMDVNSSWEGTKTRLENSIITKEALLAQELEESKKPNFDQYLIQYYQYFISIKESNTYNEMLSAGELSLIENRWIRDAFAELADDRNFILEVNLSFHNKAIQDADKFEKYVRYDIQDHGTDSSVVTPTYDFQAMTADPTFCNLISFQARTWNVILGMYGEYYKDLFQLNDSIQSELVKIKKNN